MLNTASHASPVILRAQEGTTTGISAFDRAATFRALASPTTVPGDFNRPGHVFPLRPREGGVLERDGHTALAESLKILPPSQRPYVW